MIYYWPHRQNVQAASQLGEPRAILVAYGTTSIVSLSPLRHPSVRRPRQIGKLHPDILDLNRAALVPEPDRVLVDAAYACLELPTTCPLLCGSKLVIGDPGVVGKPRFLMIKKISGQIFKPRILDQIFISGPKGKLIRPIYPEKI